MNVAILGSRGIPARYGGFETFAEALAVGLTERGYRVTVFCEGERERSESVYKGVRLVSVPTPELGPLTTILFDLRCLWAARRGYDVVYMLGYGAALFFWITKVFGTRLWVNPDGIEWARAKWGFFGRFWLKAMEWLALRTADLVVVDSEAVLQHLMQRHGFFRSSTVIAYGAVIPGSPPSDAALSRFNLDRSSYHLVVCRIEPENHVREIISGYLESGSLRPLVIVGDHQASSAYCRELREEYSSFASRVRFVGPVFDPAILMALRYYCCTYLHGHSVGGTNPSLLESLACGNIVIAHENAFNREVAAQAACYFHSPSQLASQLRAIDQYSTEQRQIQMTRARERVLLRYTWDRVITAYANLLGSQAEKKNSDGKPCVY